MGKESFITKLCDKRFLEFVRVTRDGAGNSKLEHGHYFGDTEKTPELPKDAEGVWVNFATTERIEGESGKGYMKELEVIESIKTRGESKAEGTVNLGEITKPIDLKNEFPKALKVGNDYVDVKTGKKIDRKNLKNYSVDEEGLNSWIQNNNAIDWVKNKLNLHDMWLLVLTISTIGLAILAGIAWRASTIKLI